jgi:hypothetical protein
MVHELKMQIRSNVILIHSFCNTIFVGLILKKVKFVKLFELKLLQNSNNSVLHKKCNLNIKIIFIICKLFVNIHVK